MASIEEMKEDMKGLAPEFYIEYSQDLTQCEILFINFEQLDKDTFVIKDPITHKTLGELIQWVNKCLKKSCPVTKT